MSEDLSQFRLLSLMDVFQPLGEEGIVELVSRSPEIRLAEGQDLDGLEDAYSQGLLVVKVGRVRLFRVGATSRSLTLATLPAGAVLSTWHTQGLRVKALSESVLIFADRQRLQQLIRDHPEVGLRLMERLTEYVRLLADRLFDVTQKKVSSRLASLVLTLLDLEGVVSRWGYEIPTHYTHEELGAMIGAQRVAVTRAFNYLRETGALEIANHRIRVKNVSVLQSIAGEER